MARVKITRKPVAARPALLKKWRMPPASSRPMKLLMPVSRLRLPKKRPRAVSGTRSPIRLLQTG